MVELKTRFIWNFISCEKHCLDDMLVYAKDYDSLADYQVLNSELKHWKCQSKANTRIALSVCRKTKMAILNRDEIFTHKIHLYKQQFDWLFIVAPIWLVWHTYISHSLTHCSTHNIAQIHWRRDILLTKKITQKSFLSIPILLSKMSVVRVVSYTTGGPDVVCDLHTWQYCVTF